MSGGQRQAIAMARAVHFNAKCLIMDERTAALGPQETIQVGKLILHLRGQGLGIHHGGAARKLIQLGA
jgi:D-xylose transport system ATP-binding protein